MENLQFSLFHSIFEKKLHLRIFEKFTSSFNIGIIIDLTASRSRIKFNVVRNYIKQMRK